MSRRLWVLGAATLVAGCGAGPQPLVDRDEVAGRAASEAPPARFEVGRAATPEEIARLDIDVGPDGAGLPPGSGTAAVGSTIYAAKCAVCHGLEGEGVRGLGSRLVGRADGDRFDFALTREGEGAKTVGSYWPYAPTLFDYIRRAMPFDRPGTLTDDEVYALSAWILWKNGLIAEGDGMDASTLPHVAMPARDRFVPDDREGSTRVR